MASIAFGARPLTQINAADWATLEEAGCVFLPTGSYLNHSGTGGVVLGEEQLLGSRSSYWTATAHNASQAYRLLHDNRSTGRIIQGDARDGRYYAFPVRLAQDL